MGIEKLKINNIFDLKGIPPYRQYYDNEIAKWSRIYRGQVSWDKCRCTTIADGNKERKMAHLNLSKVICEYLANLTWAEGINIEIGDEKTKEFIDITLDRNNFLSAMRQLTERVYATGGGAIKAYVDKFNRIQLQYLPAEQFVPITWNNAEVQEGVFIDKSAKDGLYYTRLEFHTKDRGIYTISNRLFVSPTQDIYGEECPVSLMYENIEPETRIENLKSTLFFYFSNSCANNADLHSPLGMSVFANCIDTLRIADNIYDSLEQEFKLGRRRIIVPTSAIREITTADGQTRRYFDSSDSVFEAMFMDGVDSGKIIDNSVGLRVNEHISSLNAVLEVLSLQCGLSTGSIAFTSQGVKTATEIVSENSKTFRLIKQNQQPIIRAIKGLVQAICELAVLYGIDDNVRTDAEIKVSFNDNIIEDKATETLRAMELVRNGLMSKENFLINYMGLTAQQAKDEIAKINTESSSMLLGV